MLKQKASDSSNSVLSGTEILPLAKPRRDHFAKRLEVVAVCSDGGGGGGGGVGGGSGCGG